MSGAVEAARILREYERRDATIPADFYSLDRPANYFAHSQLALRINSLQVRDQKIADIGCGRGDWLLQFIQWGANPADLYGIDLSATRIEEARKRMPLARLETGDASVLPLPDESMDMVCQFTAFSSVLDGVMKQELASEMMRILRGNGTILWYDLRIDNPANPAVHGIGLKEVRRLFPDCSIEAQKVTLAPPIARAVAPRSRLLATLLERIPFLCSHYLLLIRKTK